MRFLLVALLIWSAPYQAWSTPGQQTIDEGFKPHVVYILSLKSPNGLHIRATYLENDIVAFAFCQNLTDQPQCEPIGRSSGYATSDLANRFQYLQERRQSIRMISVGVGVILFAATVGKALHLGLRSSAPVNKTQDLVFSGVLGAIVGSSLGASTGSLVTLLAPNYELQAKAIKSGLMPKSDELYVLTEETMLLIVQELNYALAGM